MHSDEDMLGLLLTEKKGLQEGEVTDLTCRVCARWLPHRESNFVCFFHVGLVAPATCFWCGDGFCVFLLGGERPDPGVRAVTNQQCALFSP